MWDNASLKHDGPKRQVSCLASHYFIKMHAKCFSQRGLIKRAHRRLECSFGDWRYIETISIKLEYQHVQRYTSEAMQRI